MPFNGKEHKLTDEDRAKGRKVKSRRRCLSSSLKSRKNCNDTCFMWPCMFQPLSNKKYNGKCALKEIEKENPIMVKKYKDVMINGKEGLQKQVKELISSLMVESGSMGVKDKYMTIRAANDFNKSFYGQKIDIDGNLGVDTNIKGAITIDKIKEAMEKIHGSKRTSK
jgi:hypothetical protein